MASLLATFVGLFSACSADKTKDQLIVGTWNANSIKVNGVESINTTPSYTHLTLTFNADKTFTASSDAGSNSGTWTITDNTIHIESSPLSYTYNIQKLEETNLETTTSVLSVTIEEKFSK